MKPNYVEVYGTLINLKEKFKELERSLSSLMAGMEEVLSEPESEPEEGRGQFETSISDPALSEEDWEEMEEWILGRNKKEQAKQLK